MSFLGKSKTIQQLLNESKIAYLVDIDGKKVHLDTLVEDKPLLLYFWATWCKPCIIEMPYFEEMAQENNADVEMVFVSLDYADKVDSKVKPFLTKKKIQSPVYLIDDLDYNKWIEKVDPRWSGAIPATVFVSPAGKRYFYEKEFEKEELNNLVKTLLNQ